MMMTVLLLMAQLSVSAVQSQVPEMVDRAASRQIAEDIRTNHFGFCFAVINKNEKSVIYYGKLVRQNLYDYRVATGREYQLPSCDVFFPPQSQHKGE